MLGSLTTLLVTEVIIALTGMRGRKTNVSPVGIVQSLFTECYPECCQERRYVSYPKTPKEVE
jgi:hypothetical protein